MNIFDLALFSIISRGYSSKVTLWYINEYVILSTQNMPCYSKNITMTVRSENNAKEAKQDVQEKSPTFSQQMLSSSSYYI